MTEPRDLLRLDYTSLPMDVESSVTLSASTPGLIHAVAIWVDFQLDEKERWSTFFGAGRKEDGVLGAPENTFEKQMLRFLPRPEVVPDRAGASGDEVAIRLKVEGRFEAGTGIMGFDVAVTEA